MRAEQYFDSMCCLSIPNRNSLLLPAETSVKRIEDSFKEYTNRDDIAIVLINQYIADMIRHQVANYMKVAQPVVDSYRIQL